ncbi:MULTISPECIES: hypothetical protein [Erwinia]|uniref:hypothetical protein n=1 Tax=Erwinia TaxID=551 RepID=UPI001331420C|nr:MULTISPECIES: hypothetical protein [Erwinia]MBP2153501.1 hypothetical protein [Erwinia rhapontici]NNS08804.1 hypothetical protein [Erwinia sp. JH02]UDQ80410.1 hypothetical protein LJN55_00640 [Erwinia rhapontici]
MSKNSSRINSLCLGQYLKKSNVKAAQSSNDSASGRKKERIEYIPKLITDEVK